MVITKNKKTLFVYFDFSLDYYTPLDLAYVEAYIEKKCRKNIKADGNYGAYKH